MNFAEEQIQSSDSLLEMSMGDWEGLHGSEIYTPEILNLMERHQPDFSCPSGESLRQVEFRMVQFLNETVLGLSNKLRADFSHHNSHLGNSNNERDGGHHWDLLHRHRPALSRKKSGKSRLQVVTTTGNNEIDDEMSPRDMSQQNDINDNLSVRSSASLATTTCIGVFTHASPIKCLLTGILSCGPLMSHKFCVEDSSVTVLQHSWRMGWQIKRLNDTAHLRLL